MMYGLYNNWGYMGWLGGGIIMVLFWALFIWLIVWIVRSLSGQNSQQSGSKALEILKERYSKGEISREEFESKKKDISG